MKAALDILTTAPEFDLVLAVVGSSARFHPELAVQPIIDCDGCRQAARRVPGAGCSRSARSARPGRRRRISTRPRPAPTPSRPRSAAACRGCSLDRRGLRALAMRFRPLPATAAGSTSSKPMRCSTASALPRAPALALDIACSAGRRSLPFAYPVAVKVLAAGIAHKSDVGGVVLGIADATRCSQRSIRSARTLRSTGPAWAWIACWCSR